jgi:hypothetical protein
VSSPASAQTAETSLSTFRCKVTSSLSNVESFFLLLSFYFTQFTDLSALLLSIRIIQKM